MMLPRLTMAFHRLQTSNFTFNFIFNFPSFNRQLPNLADDLENIIKTSSACSYCLTDCLHMSAVSSLHSLSASAASDRQQAAFWMSRARASFIIISFSHQT